MQMQFAVVGVRADGFSAEHSPTTVKKNWLRSIRFVGEAAAFTLRSTNKGLSLLEVHQKKNPNQFLKKKIAKKI